MAPLEHGDGGMSGLMKEGKISKNLGAQSQVVPQY